jgi:hypothetical protein
MGHAAWLARAAGVGDESLHDMNSRIATMNRAPQGRTPLGLPALPERGSVTHSNIDS